MHIYYNKLNIINIDRTLLDVKSPPGSIGGLHLSSKRSLDRPFAPQRQTLCSPPPLSKCHIKIKLRASKAETSNYEPQGLIILSALRRLAPSQGRRVTYDRAVQILSARTACTAMHPLCILSSSRPSAFPRHLTCSDHSCGVALSDGSGRSRPSSRWASPRC